MTSTTNLRPTLGQLTHNTESEDMEACKALRQPSKHHPTLTNAQPLNTIERMKFTLTFHDARNS